MLVNQLMLMLVGYIPTIVTSIGFSKTDVFHIEKSMDRAPAVYNAALDALAHEPQNWATWPA